MFKPFEFCIPTKGITVPSGPEYLHEIKYDGYRLLLKIADARPDGCLGVIRGA